ncbi:2-hydroxyacid dehydrogenase [Salsipaludibacter albus]|uniref:2-hydroxyacid dehydrogenase n=1 Tax=Salsipaludibacter albus TaxID=2849650 RepID=UPI001EE3B14C|nr:2-hydroxyacid dehydrogenase [Salsipaludibacter albus]MBY5162231.1 2-hydroxyacid dehydrogenase [Salsipaludibacter albus]
MTPNEPRDDARRMVVFSAQRYDREGFGAVEHHGIEVVFLDTRLTARTAELARGAPVVCAFVNDDLSADVLEVLAEGGTQGVALRCAGFNNVDLAAAERLGLRVLRVPAYSPNAVAEHTLALILALNRKIHRAYNRVRDGNFALDGLVGFDLAGTTVAVVGTGQIGAIVARLLWHLRCRVLCVDPYRHDHLLELGAEYVSWEQACAQADIITLNCPLTDDTHHLVDAAAVDTMRDGVMLVNTGRGPLVDTDAVIEGLKSGRIGSLALDVYEEEADLFFTDRSDEIIDDDRFARLLTFPNVLITAHQAFLTREALDAIARTTLANAVAIVTGEPADTEVSSTT